MDATSNFILSEMLVARSLYIFGFVLKDAQINLKWLRLHLNLVAGEEVISDTCIRINTFWFQFKYP